MKCAKRHGGRPAAAGRRRIPRAKVVAAATALQGAFGTGIFRVPRIAAGNHHVDADVDLSLKNGRASVDQSDR